jgi:hypothetical protein
VSGTGGTGGGEQEPVGSLGVEAAKLLSALQDWAKDSGGEYAGATASATAGAAATMQSINEHIATGGQDCTYCPVCQVISAVRGTSPEVREHLRSAASSLVQAAAGVLATPVPDQGDSRRKGPVEKIDIGDDEEEDD